MVYCYDYSFARTINSTGIDMILVTNSGDMVALGYTDTVPIAMEEITILASVTIIFWEVNKWTQTKNGQI